MDYEVGSIADLISGNHTPNRRKVAKKPLTPVKLPPIINVTPATPRDAENVKSRTPKLAFTPEVPLKSATKINTPARDQFESPKSVPKKRKSKLSNNFQFLSQLPDHSDSGNEGFGEDDETGEVEEFLGMKKSKKYTKEEGKRVIKEYYIGKEELNGNPPKGKMDQKNNKNLNKEKVETSPKKKKNKDAYVEPIVIENLIVSQEKKSKKKKNKNIETRENEIGSDNGTLESSPQKKKKKRKSESKDNAEERAQDSGSENNSDDELPMSDNELEINEELEENAPESEDDNQEDIPQTDFQRAASRRIEKKLQKEEKFSPDEIDKTLFVGNIPVSVLQKNHEKVLRHMFSPYGGIESVRIRNIPLADFKTKPKVALIEKKFHAERTTVIAYIKYRNADSVRKALVENNSLLEGNHLRVDRCYQDKKVPVDTRKTIFLGNLPFNIEEETLREVFSNCGNILSVRLVRDRQTQIGKGIGFINFEKSDGVELAMSMSEEDLVLKKKTIRVQRYNASNNKRENPRDNKNKGEGKRNQRENRVVGKRYQKFHPEPVETQFKNKPNYGKKRDEQGNKMRKRHLEGNSNNKQKRNNTDQTEGDQTAASEPSFKKFKKHNPESEANTAEHNNSERNNGEENAVANNSEGGKDNAVENNKDGSRPSRKERSIDFKGLIAKKKKKFKMNKAILKKKKISKILLHDAKN